VQSSLSLNARFILKRLENASARRQERAFYRLQIAPLLAAIFFAGALCLPEYLHYEPTHQSEPVGCVSLLVAAAVTLWFGSALFRGLRLTLRTLLFLRACCRSGHIVRGSVGTPPVVALAEQNPPVALVGFLHPCILISAGLLDTGGLNGDALEVALDHERSHAAHRDNWKLLVLSFLPCLALPLSGSNRWKRHWQSAADWAADDDAVRGDPARSILLAEALVRTARSVTKSHGAVICAALTSAEAGFAARIDRLLRPAQDGGSTRASLPLGMAALLLLGLGVVGIASPWVYALSEHILHLGGF
jgi:hypothetical protein